MMASQPPAALGGLSRAQVAYLAQEAVLFLLVSFCLLIGGTFNGLVLYRFNVLNAGVIAAAGAAWLGWRLWRRRAFPATRLDSAVLALLGAYALATAASSDVRRSAGALLLVVVYALVFYLVVDLVRAGWPAALWPKVLLLTSVFILFFGWWEVERWHAGWLAIGGWVNPLPPGTMRVRAFLGHPNFVAAYFALLMPLALASLAAARGRAGRALLAVWLLAAGLLVFYTSSRGGWLGAGLGLAATAALLTAGRWRHWRVAVLDWLRQPQRALSALVVAGAVLVIGGVLVYRQLQHPTHSGREHIWSVGWEMFARDPLTGQGPNTYGTAYVRAFSVPPLAVLAHAHNYALNVLAETGLPGGLALLALAVLAAWVARRRWRAAPPAERPLLAGILGSLAAAAGSSLFDTPQTFPALSVMIAALLALLAAGDVPGRAAWHPAGGWGLAGAWLAVAAGLGWSLPVYGVFSQGVLAANLGDWASAARLLDESAARDAGLAFYWLQAGYAHGRLALNPDGTAADAAHLQAAIAAYERGLALEPDYGPDWANLAVLRWAQGQRTSAVRAMEQAVRASPSVPAFQLTLGRMYETQTRQNDARLAYVRALSLEPEWQHAYFFRQTPLRAEVLALWKAQANAGRPSGFEAQGWAALESGHAAQALEMFTAALGLNTPRAYLGLGLAQLAAQDYASAEAVLRTALFVPGLEGYDRVYAHLGLARAHAARGDCASAVSDYQAGLGLLEGTTAFGVGTLGSSEYGWYVFNRESIAPDLLPGMDSLTHTDETAAALVELAGCYAALGRPEAAARARCEAWRAAPDRDLGLSEADLEACE